MERQVLLPDRFWFFVFGFLCWVFLPACVGTETSETNTCNSFINKNDTALRKQGGFLFLKDIKVNACLVDIDANNDTLYKCRYVEGKEEGRETIKYPNGQIAELRFYRKGKKEGEHKGWYVNGKQKFVYNYKNDIYEGSVKEWTLEGQLYKHFNYKNGKEEGRQRLWYADGKIRANYDVKDGRKYGLTGVKNCVNVTENESE